MRGVRFHCARSIISGVLLLVLEFFGVAEGAASVLLFEGRHFCGRFRLTPQISGLVPASLDSIGS